MRRASLFRSLAAPAAVLLMLFVGVTLVLSGRLQSDDDPVAVVPSGPEVSVEDSAGSPAFLAPDVRVAVVVDGWSYRTLEAFWASSGASPELEARFSSASGEIFQSRQLLDFTPLSGVLLGQLLEVEPAAVALLMDRMVRYDPAMVCVSSSCSSQRGSLDPAILLDINSVPVFGRMYDEWGVSSAAHIAFLAVPAGAASVELSGEGLGSTVIQLTRPVEGDPVDGGEAVEPVRPSVLMLGSAFGALFELSPAWLTGSGVFEGRPYEVPYVFSDIPDGATGLFPAALGDGAALSYGLAFPVPAAAELSPSWLTMLSSPTFGCYAAMCVPEDFSPSRRSEVLLEGETFDVSEERSSHGAACVATRMVPTTGVASPSTRLLAAGFSARWDVGLSRPFHQTGFWQGYSAEELSGHVSDGRGVFSGDPVLVDGDLSARVHVTWVLAGLSLTPHLVDFASEATEGEPAWEDWASVVKPC